MTWRILSGGRIVLRVSLVALVTSATGAACGGTVKPDTGPTPQQVPAPEPCPKEGPPTNQAQLLGCIQGMEFDTTDLAGDEQRLMLNPPCPGTCRYGPLAKIEPVKRAHEYTDEELQQGRIIARMFVREGENGYRKLALVPGHITYWWVQIDATGRSGRSLFISDAMVDNKLVTARPRRRLEVYPYPPGTVKQALAKWHWLPDDETAKGTCGSATCN